jgi:hypothetical protein
MRSLIRVMAQLGKKARRKTRRWSKNREVKGLEKYKE